MPISIAEKLLVSILKKKAIKVLPKVQEKWFDKKELPCYRVIMDHFRAHGELLGYKSFCDKFGFDYKEVDSSPDAYLTDVKNRYTYTKLAEKIPPILRRDENDIEDSLRAITELVSELNSSDLHSTETRFSENAEERFNDYFDLKSNKGITYLSTGSEVLDTLLLGYRRQDLVTFAARAGGKKTFLMCYLALLCEKAMTNATYGDILFITNEVPAKEIIQRMDSIKYKLPYNDFIHGTLSGKKEIAYHKGLEKLSASKSVIQILENVTTIDALSAKVLLYQPAIVFLDGSYLLESSYKGDDWKKILYITRNLKQIAKDTGVPIINTTQLKRASGKSKKGSFDAQDDFAYGNSYVQDSDAAFTGFIDADMQYRGDVGYQIAKGRRMSESEYPIFECPLHSMELNIKLNEDDEVAETEEVDY